MQTSRTLWTSLLLLLAGCSEHVFDANYDGGSAFVLSGEVSPTVVIDPEDDVMGAILWAWSLDGATGVSIEPVPTEIRLFRYSLEVPPPPVPLAASQGLPDAWPGLAELDLLVGVPVLLAAPPGADVTVSVRADGVFDWVGDNTSLEAQLAAVAPGHLLVVYDADVTSSRLGEAPEWSGHCALDDAVAGFTLYRRDALGCGGWSPLAEPGSRTEFQGVGMTPP